MVISLLILSFAVRLVYIIQLKSTIFYSNFLLDESFYNLWARKIASGEGMGNSAFEALPLFPYLLGFLYKVFGYNLLIPRLFSIILASLSCLLIYLVTKKLFGNIAGICAGVIAALYGPLIFYSGLLAPSSVAIFLYCLVILCILLIIEKETFIRFFTLGLLLGLASLSRAGILLFIPAIFFWFLLKAKERKGTALRVLIGFLGLICIILPVTIRNLVVSGDLVFLTSHSGINFFIGNNEKADGTYKAPEWSRTNIEGMKRDAKTIAERDLNRTLSEGEVSRYYFHKAIDFMKKNPAKFLKLLILKLRLTFNSQELYDAAYYPVYADFIRLLKLPFFSFFLIGPLGILGILLSARRWRELMPLYIFIASYTLSIVIYFVNSRYRLPLAMMLMIFSGYTISWIIQKVKSRDVGHLTKAMCALLVLGVIVNYPTGIEVVSSGYVNLGTILMDNSRWDEAIAALNRAIELDSSDPKPYNDIGYIYIAQNRLSQGQVMLRKSLSIDPNYPYAYINLGLVFERKGDLGRAESEYKKAIALNPNIAMAHNNLGNIFSKKKIHSLAIKEYRLAIELDPLNAKTHYNLGVIYGREGRLRESKEELETTLDLDREFEPARDLLRYFK
ncbi:tetratricopeptide repeat protein [Candidatus Omnitrophota bacterium]